MSLPFIPTSEVNEESSEGQGYRLPLDLNQLLINRPSSTFLLCNATDKFGVRRGDILVVDRSVEPKREQLVVGVEDGDLCLLRAPVREVWGTVTYVIHKTW